MRVQISHRIDLKRLAKFIRQRPCMKYLHLCARSEGTLIFMYADRNLEILANVIEAGSVEVDRAAFGRILGAFQRDIPLDIWEEGFEIKLSQGNFMTSLTAWPKLNDDEFNGAASRRIRKDFQQVRNDILALYNVKPEHIKTPVDDEINCYEIVSGEEGLS